MIACLQKAAVTGDTKQAEQKLGQSSIGSGAYLCPLHAPACLSSPLTGCGDLE